MDATNKLKTLNWDYLGWNNIDGFSDTQEIYNNDLLGTINDGFSTLIKSGDVTPFNTITLYLNTNVFNIVSNIIGYDSDNNKLYVYDVVIDDDISENKIFVESGDHYVEIDIVNL
jgi:hypothetical protein